MDSIGDFLTIIRNGIMISKPKVRAPFSSTKHAIALLLKDEGFIWDVATVEDNDGKKWLEIRLKYVDGESVIHEIKRVSTPGCRTYAGSKTIKPVIGNLGLSILTTDRGIISNKQAARLGVGGEVICTVW